MILPKNREEALITTKLKYSIGVSTGGGVLYSVEAGIFPIYVPRDAHSLYVLLMPGILVPFPDEVAVELLSVNALQCLGFDLLFKNQSLGLCMRCPNRPVSKPRSRNRNLLY